MNEHVKFFFVTGCPGSAWSMISQRIKISIDKFDNSDESTDRSYYLPDSMKQNYVIKDEKWVGKTHHGAYFGPYHEYGHYFDNLNYYNKDDFYKECMKPFSKNNPYKMIKSHWFAYNLNWLWNNCKGHNIILIWRESKYAEDWWHKMGGFNIQYPNYKWYESKEKMHIQIEEENQLIMKFAKERNAKWENFDSNSNWLKKIFNIDNPKKFQTFPIWKDNPKISFIEIK